MKNAYEHFSLNKTPVVEQDSVSVSYEQDSGLNINLQCTAPKKILNTAFAMTMHIIGWECHQEQPN